MHSDDADFGICFLDGAGNATDQATAADRDYDHLNFGMLLQYFQSKRALACDDRVIVERMDESEMLLLAAPYGFFASFVVICADQNDFSPV